MSMVTFVWAAVIGACATMALPHFLIGIKHRARQNLFFALAALSVAGIACEELAIMHGQGERHHVHVCYAAPARR